MYESQFSSTMLVSGIELGSPGLASSILTHRAILPDFGSSFAVSNVSYNFVRFGNVKLCVTEHSYKHSRWWKRVESVRSLRSAWVTYNTLFLGPG